MLLTVSYTHLLMLDYIQIIKQRLHVRSHFLLGITGKEDVYKRQSVSFQKWHISINRKISTKLINLHSFIIAIYMFIFECFLGYKIDVYKRQSIC